MRQCIPVFAIALVLGACGESSNGPPAPAADASYAPKLQQQLLDAKPGDVIEIPAGRYAFDRSLTLRANGVTIRGAGMDKSVLSFKGQKAGAEGLLVNGDNFTIENLTIEDSKGDGLKISESKQITIRGVKVQWTGGPSTKNGAYGLYPVKTSNVLIEDCVAIAASDAGIYVGQSRDVIVRRSRAESNVAGIEIENTINADVYDNVATNNTGGILVFNMPALSQQAARSACSRTGSSPTTPATSAPREPRWPACRPVRAWSSIPTTTWKSSTTTSPTTPRPTSSCPASTPPATRTAAWPTASIRIPSASTSTATASRAAAIRPTAWISRRSELPPWA